MGDDGDLLTSQARSPRCQAPVPGATAALTILEQQRMRALTAGICGQAGGDEDSQRRVDGVLRLALQISSIRLQRGRRWTG